jgi:hypothetical protein
MPCGWGSVVEEGKGRKGRGGEGGKGEGGRQAYVSY